MINLGYDNSGDLISVSADSVWWQSFFLHGDYELSTSAGPGIYQVVNEGGAGWFTTIDYPSPLDHILTDESGILVFDRVGGLPLTGATPEPASYLLLAMGLTAMLFMKKFRRHSRALV